MFIRTNFLVSFFRESTTFLASPQFRSPVSFNLSQLASTRFIKKHLDAEAVSVSMSHLDSVLGWHWK